MTFPDEQQDSAADVFGVVHSRAHPAKGRSEGCGYVLPGRRERRYDLVTDLEGLDIGSNRNNFTRELVAHNIPRLGHLAASIGMQLTARGVRFRLWPASQYPGGELTSRTAIAPQSALAPTRALLSRGTRQQRELLTAVRLTLTTTSLPS